MPKNKKIWRTFPQSFRTALQSPTFIPLGHVAPLEDVEGEGEASRPVFCVASFSIFALCAVGTQGTRNERNKETNKKTEKEVRAVVIPRAAAEAAAQRRLQQQHLQLMTRKYPFFVQPLTLGPILDSRN